MKGRRAGAAAHAGEEVLRVALFELRQATRQRNVSIEVADRVRDRTCDMLMTRPALGKDARGRVSRSRIRAHVRRIFGWEIASYQRLRLEGEGELRPGPRTARSLESSQKFGAKSRRLHETVASDLAGPLDQLVVREDLAEVVAIASDGPPEDRRVLEGHLRGESASEIAEATGLSPNTVSARMSRMRKRATKRTET